MIGRNKQYEAFDKALLDYLECVDVGATELAVNGMYIIRILNPGPDQY